MPEDQTTSFSTTGEEAVARIIDAQPDATADALSPKEFDDFYDIERTAEEIVKGDYKRIALQFPDELLHDSVPIFRQLKRCIGQGRELYVLADTSYGSCCVDEVAASHVDADAMVHFGHACMSQTSRLPVIYIFGKKRLDIDDCVDSLLKAFKMEPQSPSHILLRHDVVYTHQANSIQSRLREKLDYDVTIIYHKLLFRTESASTSTQTLPATPSTDHATIFYVGAESLGLTNLLMTNSSCQVLSYNPRTKITRLESAQTNRLLMRRYATVQKARNADVFGILVGTLGVASYLPLIKHIRTLLSKKQKKSYTISVGKLNPAKLANFLEIECFILIACPENSMIESKDFLRPIVTPYELEVALQDEPSWTGRYVLNFGEILAEAAADDASTDETVPNANSTTDADNEDHDQPVFSLITGTYRHAKRYDTGKLSQPTSDPTSAQDSSAVVLRNPDSAVAKFGIDSAAGQFLQQRLYQGLEARWGADAPSLLEQGRSGVARGYQDDRTHQDYAQAPNILSSSTEQ